MTALSLPVIIGAIGLSIDVGVWDGQQVALQAATDAGAVKAARDLAENAATPAATLQADALAAANLASSGQFNLTSASLSLSQLADNRQVQVSATVPAEHFFSQLVFPSPVNISASSTAGIAYTTVSSQATCYGVDADTYLYSTGVGTIDTSHSSGIDPFQCGSPPSPPAAYGAYCGGGVLGCELNLLGLGSDLLPVAFQIGPQGGAGGLAPNLATILQTLNDLLLGGATGSPAPLVLNQGSPQCPGNVCTIAAGIYNGGISFGPGLNINFVPAGPDNVFMIENGNLVISTQDNVANTDPGAVFFLGGDNPGAFIAATQVQLNTAAIDAGALILTSKSVFQSNSLAGTQTSAPLSAMPQAQQDALSAGLLSILGTPGENLVGTNFLSVVATCPQATSFCNNPTVQPPQVQFTPIPSLGLLGTLGLNITLADMLANEGETSTTTITSGLTLANGVPTDWSQQETANNVLTNTLQTVPSVLAALGLPQPMDGAVQGVLNLIAPNATASQSAGASGVFSGQTSRGTPVCDGQPVLYSQTITPDFSPGFTDVLNSAGESGATGAVTTSDTVTVCGTAAVASITPITPGTTIVASTAGGSSTIALLK